MMLQGHQVNHAGRSKQKGAEEERDRQGNEFERKPQKNLSHGFWNFQAKPIEEAEDILYVFLVRGAKLN